MSDLPFEIPTDVDGIRNLFVETRALLSSQWEGLSEEQMTQRPGPHPEWSVKDIIAHNDPTGGLVCGSGDQTSRRL